MTIYTETQRIYVASLKDYNAGNLHGIHIDLNECTDLDEVWERINAMLAASPEAKEFPQGGPAEEWAIHDFEGFGSYRLHEYESIAKVFKVAKLIEAKGAAASEWLANDDSVLDDADLDTPEALIEWFEGCFMGEYDNGKDYAYHYVRDVGLPGIGSLHVETGRYDGRRIDVLEELENYLDWDALAEWALSDETVIEMGGGKIAVFRSEP